MRTDTLPKNQLKKSVPDMRTGQVVRVHERIQEGNKERVQVFEGLVIAVKHGKGLDGTFTVRKIGAGGVGVERIFPVHMPAIEKIEVLRQEKVRRSKLYFVRDQVGKKTKKRKTKLQSVIYDMADTEETEEPGDADEVAGADEDTQAEEVKTEESPETTETEESAEKEGDKEDKPEDNESKTEDSGEEKDVEEDSKKDEQKTEEESGDKEEVEKTEEPEEKKEGVEESEDQEEEKEDTKES